MEGRRADLGVPRVHWCGGVLFGLPGCGAGKRCRVVTGLERRGNSKPTKGANQQGKHLYEGWRPRVIFGDAILESRLAAAHFLGALRRLAPAVGAARDRESLPFQLQLEYTRPADGARCLRVATASRVTTTDREAAEQRANIAALAPAAEQQAAALAIAGEVTQARAAALAKQKLDNSQVSSGPCLVATARGPSASDTDRDLVMVSSPHHDTTVLV